MKYLFFACVFSLQLTPFALDAKFEMFNYATEGIAVIEDHIAAASMKDGFIRISNNELIFLDNFLDDWNSDHKIMGIGYDANSNKLFFVSPNYRGGSLLSLNINRFRKLNKIRASIFRKGIIRTHVTEAGPLNDIKISQDNVIATNSNMLDGKIYKFDKLKLIKNLKPRKIADSDVLNDGIDFVNGIYLDKRDDLYIVATTDQKIYKVNLQSGKSELFSDIAEGWPDDIVKYGSKFFVSDNKNGGIFVLNQDGQVVTKIDLSYFTKENITPANLVIKNHKLYFSDLWKASTLKIVFSELTQVDINDYQNGVYSIPMKDIFREIAKRRLEN